MYLVSELDVLDVKGPQDCPVGLDADGTSEPLVRRVGRLADREELEVAITNPRHLLQETRRRAK